jgi:hypothetical protein
LNIKLILRIEILFQNYSKSERYFGHCHIFHELHNNFTHLFCHAFVEHLVCFIMFSFTSKSIFIIASLSINFTCYSNKSFYFIPNYKSSSSIYSVKPNDRIISCFFLLLFRDHKYQFGRLNFAIRSSPILATDRSMIIPSNQNKHDEIEKNEYQKCSNNS